MLSIRIAAIPLILAALVSAVPIPAADVEEARALINPFIGKYQADVIEKREVEAPRALINPFIGKYQADVIEKQ